MTTKETGNQGERAAYELLAAKGYVIIERNVFVGNVEVDVLCRHANRLVVVEVKTRNDDHLDPNYGMTRDKIYRLCRAGSNYVRIKNLPFEVQVDAILVTNHPDGTYDIEHLEDIALPPTVRRRW